MARTLNPSVPARRARVISTRKRNLRNETIIEILLRFSILCIVHDFREHNLLAQNNRCKTHAKNLQNA